jgi:3-deoxy-manno-octulosonate cytidylyltransferase (CMP-KDO synthetase)
MLADVGGKPLVARAFECAIEADVGDVIVACDGLEIADAIRKVGGKTVLTNPDLLSGTDRVFEGWTKFDTNRRYRYIVNFQGDQPFVGPDFVRIVCRVIKNMDCDISTIAVPIVDDSYLRDSVVKPVISFSNDQQNIGRALYFSRSAVPFGGPFFHHVGIYCFKPEGLQKFVYLPPSTLEKSEKLEQLRAVENGLSIGVAVVAMEPPISVDTEEDLILARKYLTKCC